jgi:transketolase
MRDRFIATLSRVAADDSDVMLLTADLGFGVLNDFAERFPRQYLNVGVAEQNMTGVAAGLALSGKRVFTYSIANFPTLRCLEQIRNDICYHGLPVTIVSIGGGLSYGQLGFSHHATEDLAILRSLAGMTVVAPGDDDEAEAATLALASNNGPAYLRLDRATHPAAPGGAAFELGRMRVVREGHGVLLLATGAILNTTVDAAIALASRGVEAAVASCHTIKPFDEESLLRQLESRGIYLIVTVEEHTVIGGLGSVVAETLTSHLDIQVPPILRLGLPDVLPDVVGSQTFLRNQFGLNTEGIADAVMRAMAQYPRGERPPSYAS